MKLHSMVKKNKASIKRKAILKGLDIIDYEKTYTLYKVGVKNVSPYGYPDKFEVLVNAYPYVAGIVVENKTLISLVMLTLNEYFITSDIVSCVKKGKTIKIETKNSYYELKETK